MNKEVPDFRHEVNEKPKLRVLHFQNMGVGTILSREFRRFGVHSIVVSTCKHPFSFEEDAIMLSESEWSKYLGYDVLHSHDIYNPLPEFVLNHWDGRMIQHYHDPHTLGPIYQDRSVVSITSVPSIVRAVPNAIWLPLPSDTKIFNPHRRIEHEGIRVGFCDQKFDQNKPRYVPRQEIVAATEESRQISIYPLSGMIPHNMMLEYYGQIDIWVDRIGLNFYGFSAVEAAAMEIPIITQIGADEQKWVPDCPFINTSREGVTEAIRALATDSQARRSIGQASREYILKVHDSTKVAEQCLGIYKKLSNVNPD